MSPADLRFAAKALLAGLVAGVGSLATGSLDGSLDLPEYLAAATAALVALGGVYGVSNEPRKARHGRDL